MHVSLSTYFKSSQTCFMPWLQALSFVNVLHSCGKCSFLLVAYQLQITSQLTVLYFGLFYSRIEFGFQAAFVNIHHLHGFIKH